MKIIKKIREQARRLNKTIVLPESDEPRIIEAAKFINKNRIAKAVLLGTKDIEPGKLDDFSSIFYELRKHKGISQEEAKEIIRKPLYYGAMLVRQGLADGLVAGASHTTPDVARAAIYCIGVDERFITASSSFIMMIPDCGYGENGVFIFADCGIVPEPSPENLANIAISSAELAQAVLGIVPKVAMLSYSTKGSASGRLVEKVKEATEIAKKSRPDLLIDGELQVDAAIVPEVAKIKGASDVLGGRANILIFPNLEAGNISYKIVQRLAKARAIGPLLMGLIKPCSDLSRGCDVDDIIDCVAVTAIRSAKAQDRL
ncbi:MAG: phosphate acetyltransferase [Candidatus Omnitrophota bacterium]